MYYNFLQKYKKSVFQILSFPLRISSVHAIKSAENWILLYLLKKSLMENFIFWAAYAKHLATLLLIQQFQKKYTEFFNCLEIKS